MLIRFTAHEKLGQASHIIKGYTITKHAGKQYFAQVIERSKEVEAYAKAMQNIIGGTAIHKTQVDILTHDPRIISVLNQRRGLGAAFDKLFSNAYRKELTFKAHYAEPEQV